MPAVSARLPRLLTLAFLLLGATLVASGQQWESQQSFTTRMAEEEKLATGVHEMTDQEQANLDNLVAYEVASARAGGVTGFAGTFSSRRTDAELDATGLDRLSDEQRTRLDEHIAGHIADTPSVPYLTRADRGRSAGTADGKLDAEGKGPLLEVHGEVSLMVGGSRAGTYYGGSATTVISDPKGRFHAMISYGTVEGDLPYSYYYDRRDRLRGPVVP